MVTSTAVSGRSRNRRNSLNNASYSSHVEQVNTGDDSSPTGHDNADRVTDRRALVAPRERR
jgi:hypothetical protein